MNYRLMLCALLHVLVMIYSESELEEVLTTYTKLNKSASIFLGSNSKSNYDHHQHRSGTPSTASISSSAGTGTTGSTGELSRRKGSSADSVYRQAQEETEYKQHHRSEYQGRMLLWLWCCLHLVEVCELF